MKKLIRKTLFAIVLAQAAFWGSSFADDFLDIKEYLPARSTFDLWVDFEKGMTVYGDDYREDIRGADIVGSKDVPYILFRSERFQNVYLGLRCEREQDFKIYVHDQTPSGVDRFLEVTIPMKLTSEECEELAANHFMYTNKNRPIRVKITRRTRIEKTKGLFGILFTTEKQTNSFKVEISFRGAKVYADEVYVPYWAQEHN